MTILKAGTFKVSDYRKAIQPKTKVACCLRQDGHCACGKKLEPDNIEFDHDPSLNQRDYDTEAGDFIPPQGDPEFITARHGDCHKVKTNGPGGERRIHTRGSDKSEPRRLDKISVAHTEFRERLLKPKEPKAERKSKWPKRPMPKRAKAPKSAKSRQRSAP